METFTEQDINETNKKVIFSPEFIQYRLQEKKIFNLNHIETLLYGFIRFYLGLENKKFYFTNEDLAEMLDCSETTIKRAVKTLYEKGIIKSNIKTNAQGGTIRQVYYINVPTNKPKDHLCTTEGSLLNSRRVISVQPKGQKRPSNKNINNNIKEKEKREENSLSPKNEKLYLNIIKTYNHIKGREVIKSYSSWSNNVDFWLQTYTEKDIIKSIWHLLLTDVNWKPLENLTIFFRRKNKLGEVDNIGEMLIKEVPHPDTLRGKSISSRKYSAILDYYEIIGR